MLCYLHPFHSSIQIIYPYDFAFHNIPNIREPLQLREQMWHPIHGSAGVVIFDMKNQLYVRSITCFIMMIEKKRTRNLKVIPSLGFPVARISFFIP